MVQSLLVVRSEQGNWQPAIADGYYSTNDTPHRGLREPAGLERLAEDERKDCLALWAEVGAVLARCGTTP